MNRISFASGPVKSLQMDSWSARRGEGKLKAVVYTHYGKEQIKEALATMIETFYGGKVTGYWISVDDEWRVTEHTVVLAVEFTF